VRATAVNSIPDALFAPIELIRQIERTGTLLTSYALNRARRVELQGGVSRLSFDRVTVQYEGDIDSTSAAAPLTLGSASAALVHDTTNYGAISVVRGERYRLEAAPALGTIRYVNVLADYRRYVMPIPFYTIAARALHFARYGSGADDPRVPPLYLGYPSLVRGYYLNSRITTQCVVPLSDGCQEIDHMLGSRIAVGNLELRFPALRPFGISPQMYGPVPVEVALFVDGGLVWRRQPVVAGASIGSAWSAGVTLRTNVLGLGVGQFDIARPFRTVEQGWVFQVNLVPSL
jgi:outer membrane protein assembly factor BamA